MTIVLVSLVCTVGVWYYFSRMREYLVVEASRFCKELDLQFLDQTVTLKRIRFHHNKHSLLTLSFEYRFEVSQNGINRLTSSAFIKDMRLEKIIIYDDNGNIIS